MSVTAGNTIVTMAFGSMLTAIVLALAIIDIRKMILPDALNLALGAAGLTHAILIGQPDLVDAVVGSLIGASAFWVIAYSFRRLRGFEGLGLGDQKFMAAAGLWVGWQGLGLMVLVASVSALIFALLQAGKLAKLNSSTRLPFGPFLGLGVCVAWLSVQVG
jgi:leader peptidase (prepilin peptidase)/N-methyltransferase